MKRLYAVVLTFLSISGLCLDIAFAAETESITVSPTLLLVKIDGIGVSFETYNIHGSNYFRLRDIAAALNGGPAQFEVGWDAENKMVTVTTGQSYTAQGNELKQGKGVEQTGFPSTDRLLFNEQVVSLPSYRIGGSNYFKLRDLASILGFDVDFDNTSRTILISTDYIAHFPVNSSATSTLNQSQEPVYIRMIRDVSKEYFGFDLVNFVRSPWAMVTVLFYILCLLFLLIQVLRKKYYFDLSITELGVLDLYFLWGAGPLCLGIRSFVAALIGKSGHFNFLMLISASLFFLVCFAILYKPLKFLTTTIKEYGAVGVAYWIALMGLGLIGVLILLIQFVIAVIPLLLVMVLVAAAMTHRNSTVRNNDEDDFLF